jgi:hypothetical protein
VGLTKFGQNIHYSPQTFSIISNWSLKFSEFKKNFNFDPKLHFHYFLVPSLREEKENSWILVIERENYHLHQF